MERVYRFRSVKRLLGSSKELAKQEIYFASPSELNDPTEGFRSIVWRGDTIAWTNLFRHYLYCLHWICIRFAISAKELKLAEDGIPVMGEVDLAVTGAMSRLHERAVTTVFENANLAKLVEILAKSERSVGDIEMLYFLQLFHLSAIEGIRTAHLELGPPIPHLSDTPLPHPLAQIPEVLELATQMDYNNATDVILKMSSELMASLYFGGKYALSLRLRNEQADTLEENLRYLYFDFSRVYLEHLIHLLYPNWYAACFSRNCNNAATWASYGDDHKGVCLVFEGESDSRRSALTLNMLRRYDPSGGQRSARELFHDVRYGPDVVEIDFFRSLGRLPQQQAVETWYSDGRGNLSECAAHLEGDIDLWRKKYWKRFLPGIIQKSADWQHEKETRLILHGLLDDLAPEDRMATYEFSSLVGIIFGIRTPDSAKIEVIDVIRQKCGEHGRERFQFSQAYYSRQTDQIENYELINYRQSE